MNLPRVARFVGSLALIGSPGSTGCKGAPVSSAAPDEERSDSKTRSTASDRSQPQPRSAAPPAPGTDSDAKGVLVVLEKEDATAHLIDPESGTTVARIPVGEGPHEVAVSANGEIAVVTNYGNATPGSSLTLIDVPARRVTKTIDLAPHRRPHGVAWLSDGSHVVVTSEESKSLLCVDVMSGTIDCTIETGQDVSHMVAVDPVRNRAYVANMGSGTMSAVDLHGQRITGHVRTGKGAEGIAMTPDGREIWVTNRAADTVSVVDSDTLQVTHSLRSATFPIRAEVTPSGAHVLVTNAVSGTLSVFDTQDHELARTLDFAPLVGDKILPEDGPAPIGIEIDGRLHRAYVALAQANVVAVVDLQSWRLAGRFETGAHPDGMALARQ